MSIFVAIASYCDPWLWKTVEDAYAKARYPQRLTFGVVDQSHSDGFEASEAFAFKRQICYQFVSARDTLGLSWARDRVFSLYGEQRYLLQIDSHCCFDQDWDETLITWFEEQRLQHPRLVLTGYPMRCAPEDGRLVASESSRTFCQYVSRPGKNARLQAHSTTISFNAMPLEDIKTLQFYPAIHLSGGFFFTTGNFVLEIPYDPRNGHVDEQNLFIRAYTHGWDIIHPPYVPLYHYYNVDPKKWDSELCWNYDTENRRRFRVSEHNAQGDRRMANMLYHGQDYGVYGLGKVRTLEDYARFSGIDYPMRKIYWRYPDLNESIEDKISVSPSPLESDEQPVNKDDQAMQTEQVSGDARVQTINGRVPLFR